MSLDDLVEEYVEKFNENVPLVVIRGKTNEEIEEILKESIEKGEPITVEYDQDSDY